eukprot:scaffold233175_cov37-Tisochrysis_lutea.AAC.3
MQQNEVQEAFELMKDIEPTSPQEYILKGVTNLALGQQLDSREHLKVAQQYFQLLGASASECDTIPGRQCMASCFFILRQVRLLSVTKPEISRNFGWQCPPPGALPSPYTACQSPGFGL